MSYRSDYLSILSERGFIYQMSNEQALDELLCSSQVLAYIGFDATASSLHVGSLLPIMSLYWLEQTGHRPIVLLGGGTTRVGDPSGKDEQRSILSVEQIDKNISSLTSIFSNFLTFGEDKSLLLNNIEWLENLNYLDFLREFGRHLSVNRMLTQDSVKLRLEREQPLSFLEFNYMVLQSYDFVELSRRYGCRLQIGGSDQWGNIVTGIDLNRRCNAASSVNSTGSIDLSNPMEVFGLTLPLLTTSSGKKMGKTADGAVWLDQKLTKPFDYWQFWRNTDDADVVKFLKLFTTLAVSKISRFEKLQGSELNEAKVLLANEATGMVHGAEVAASCHDVAKKLFEQGMVSDNLQTVDISRSRLQQGVNICDLLFEMKFAKSKSEARRFIEGNAISIEKQKIKDVSLLVTLQLFSDKPAILISMGKKHHKRLNVVE